MDAVAVGSGTALADDPTLDARDLELPVERQPLRVVFDRRGRLHGGLALASGRTARVAPAGAPGPPPGVEALEAETPEEALRALGARGVTSLLVEGGAELAAGLLREGLVDAVALFVAPVVLGGDARGVLGPLGVEALADAPLLLDLRSHSVGRDLLLEAELRELP
jgi:diaminohydroxyphosphoribosylaminopyrimidine deaminase/5-amino-6-(5-phosphoribosylamino)uracil reductase